MIHESLTVEDEERGGHLGNQVAIRSPSIRHHQWRSHLVVERGERRSQLVLEVVLRLLEFEARLLQHRLVRGPFGAQASELGELALLDGHLELLEQPVPDEGRNRRDQTQSDAIRRNQTRSDALCLQRLEAVLGRLLRKNFGLVQLDHVREHVEVLGLLSELGAAALHVIEQLLQLGSRL